VEGLPGKAAPAGAAGWLRRLGPFPVRRR